MVGRDDMGIGGGLNGWNRRDNTDWGPLGEHSGLVGKTL